mmetsp:Transcript_15190/g.30767  ORF Transcript_15190/g.30767 Transcript_15190/m.30767 type:complete len:170 (+) Transcript_15190:103-612(+)
MGLCSSTHHPEAHVNNHHHATLKEIRLRLASIFERMDVKGMGEITYFQAFNFLMKSKGNHKQCPDERSKEITESVKKMFNCTRAHSSKQSITEDEFIAGFVNLRALSNIPFHSPCDEELCFPFYRYSNILYPQNLSVIQLDNHLKKLFGDHCLESFPHMYQKRNNNATL